MTERPNILWVFADQMRGMAMNCAGDPNVHTPNLDRMAEDGVRFTQACSTFPVCVPFRFSLYTGQRASTRWVPGIDYRMSPAERTIAHELNDAGYQTAHVGKWHLRGGYGPDPIKAWGGLIPIPRFNQGGFQRWKGGQSFEIEDPYYFAEDDPKPRQLSGYHTDAFFSLAMDEISEMAENEAPWFMSLSVSPPHPPYLGPDFSEERRLREIAHRENVNIEAYTSFYTGMMTMEPACWEDDANIAFQRMMTEYYLMIENLDMNIGRLLSWLEGEGLAEDTIILFFSDHGDMLASHGLHGKWTFFEESVNIPLIVHIPETMRASGFEAGRVIHQPTCTEDFFPTTLEFAGLPIDPDLPGTSFASWCQGKEPDRNGVILEFIEAGRSTNFSPYRAYKDSRYKYVVNQEGPYCLFDRENDEYEMNNVLNDPEYVPVRQRMHAVLMDHLIKSEDSFYYLFCQTPEIPDA